MENICCHFGQAEQTDDETPVAAELPIIQRAVGGTSPAADAEQTVFLGRLDCEVVREGSWPMASVYKIESCGVQEVDMWKLEKVISQMVGANSGCLVKKGARRRTREESAGDELAVWILH